MERAPAGAVVVDPSGKLPGRGAYVFPGGPGRWDDAGLCRLSRAVPALQYRRYGGKPVG
jgi:predicted RNA-binding protein YlxR (DUF448 family)